MSTDPNTKTTIRRLRINNNDWRWLIVVGVGIVGCVASGPLGLLMPLTLCIFWLAELGAME